MRIEDFTFEVRDETLARLGQILPGDLVGWESVLRFNNVGTWSIELVANLPIAQLLSTPGYGIVVSHKDAGVILSGPTISAETTYESGDPVGVIKITGVDDSVILADRLAYPDPASADVQNQTKSYDSVSFMTASTAMLWFAQRNLKPGVAPASRAITGLSLATDPIAGSAISKSARFDVLGELLTEIASIDGLGFDIKQIGGALEFRVFEPTDRTGTIRMDVANKTLSKTSFGYGAPEVTHAIVAGQGEGLNRQFLDVTTTESLNSETLFNRRIETFIDQRNTSDTNELTQAGLEKLSDGGMTQTSVDVIPSSDLTMQYGTDWNLGDRVTVVVANQEVSATVTQVSIRVESNGVFVGATVGEPNGVDFEAIVTKKQAKQQTRVNALERKEVPAIVWNDAEGTYEFVMKGGNVTQQIGAEQLAYVKNNTGATLLNGRAVYPNGSTGTNKLVAYAQANAESTSTRTFGVLSEDIANGGHGWVTTFGMVHDIDTSALTEGAAVWLSPTVPGGLTSTKPTAPNHMVLIGFCVRSHAVNGSVFVKVQNGFELDELHDVAITSPAAGNVLVRNAGNTLWVNSSLSSAGIASTSDVLSAVPSGIITPFAGRFAPTGYLLCNGQAVSRTTYPNLFNAVINNLGTVTVTIASPGVFTLAAHGLEIGDSVYLRTTGALPTGLAQNVRYYVATVPSANTFTLSSSLTLTESGRTIGATIATSGTQSGTHTLFFAPYGIGDGTTTFNLPDLRGRVPVGELSADADFQAIGGINLSSTKTQSLSSSQMPAHTHTFAGSTSADGFHSHGLSNNANNMVSDANTGINWATQGGGSYGFKNSTILGNGTHSHTYSGTTSSNGSGAAHNNLQPYIVLNYIIKT